MKLIDRLFSDVMNNEAYDYAMYTIQERAMPSIIDGFKPVQRFVMYSALKNAANDFKKVTAIGGVVSEYGYNHGETSAQDTCALMSNTWSNNFPVLEGRGNFGSRPVQDAAQARYIFAKVHDNFHKIFKDNDILPEHSKSEYSIPAFYLPIIPYVLLNGVSGIATGFGTKILPHSIESVIKCVKQVLDKGCCDEPVIQFPKFIGKIDTTGDQWFMEGLYELQGKTKLEINEIPTRFDRVKYVTLLDSLVEKGTIVGYTEARKDGQEFCYQVTLKRDFDTSDENIVKVFKLRQAISQNINVIGPDNDLRHYDKASDLIRDFVKFRMEFYAKRIEFQKEKTKRQFQLASAKQDFIKRVRSGDIVLKDKTRKQLVTELSAITELGEFAEELVSLNLYHMTDDELKKLEQAAAKADKEYQYWTKTTPKKQFLSDLG